METLWRDLRLAVRTWLRRPLLAAVVILTLALGISATTFVFSLVDTVLLSPLPYGRPESLAVVRAGLPGHRHAVTQLSGPELLALSERARALRVVGGLWARPGVMGSSRSAIEIEVGWITPGLLEAFDVRPQLGRLPSADEHLRTDVIVLSDALWRQQFGAAADIIGQRIEFDREPRTVVGVMPRAFRMLFPAEDGVPESVQAWLPWGGDLNRMSRGFRVFTVVGRLHDGIGVEALRAELAPLAQSIAGESTDYAKSGFELSGDSLANSLVATVRPTLVILFAVVALVLIIACANVANLQLIHVIDRSTEFAVRLALGAGRRHLWRQIITESALIGGCSAGLGLVITSAGILLLRYLDPTGIPRVQEVGVGTSTVAATSVAAFLAAFALGSIAARYGASDGGLQRQPSRGSFGRTRPVQRLLVIAQVSLAVVLLTGAGLLLRSLMHLNTVALGFNPEGVVSVRVSLPDVRYPYDTGGRAIAEFYRSLDDQLGALPGATAGGATISPPLAGVPVRTRPYAYRTHRQEVEWGAVAANYRTVTPGWFNAIAARLVSGRFIDGGDRWDRPVAVVVDAALAQKAWPGEEAVGKPIRVELFRNGVFRPHWGEIVGVVQTIRLDGLVVPEREQVYIAHHQSPQRTMYPTLRTSGDPLAVVEELAAIVDRLEPGLPVFDVRLATSYVSTAMSQTRIAMIALGVFATVAILLAGAGVFAAIAASVSQRRREIGIRLALGASPVGVFRWTMGQGLVPAAIGVAAGLISAALVTRFLSSVLVGVSPTDPATMLSVGLLVMLIASCACALPARRAATVDPCDSLKSL